MSLIVQKFDYEELKKQSVEGKRLYACPDGNHVASVTTILDKTKDKTALIAVSYTHLTLPTTPYV